jgi:hypothetical protein
MRSSNSLATSAGRPKKRFPVQEYRRYCASVGLVLGATAVPQRDPGPCYAMPAFILALSAARLGRCALGAYINIDEM